MGKRANNRWHRKAEIFSAFQFLYALPKHSIVTSYLSLSRRYEHSPNKNRLKNMQLEQFKLLGPYEIHIWMLFWRTESLLSSPRSKGKQM